MRIILSDSDEKTNSDRAAEKIGTYTIKTGKSKRIILSDSDSNTNSDDDHQ